MLQGLPLSCSSVFKSESRDVLALCSARSCRPRNSARIVAHDCTRRDSLLATALVPSILLRAAAGAITATFMTQERCWLCQSPAAEPHYRLHAAGAEDELVTYFNSRHKYKLQRPAAWEQVNKAGADALFKAPDRKATDLGVTVTPVRIERLEQLGDANAVSDKLLAAEKKKDSTKSAELLHVASSTGTSGTNYYELDYTVSTTRGDKRIMSKVGVANKQLFIVNGSVRCEGESCKAPSPLIDIVRLSVNSFDVEK